MKPYVLSINYLVGKRLLAKARFESTGEATEVTGVVMGENGIGSQLAMVASLYAAHLFADDDKHAAAIRAVIALVDPEASPVIKQKPSTQPGLGVDTGDDLPF